MTWFQALILCGLLACLAAVVAADILTTRLLLREQRERMRVVMELLRALKSGERS